MPHSNSYAISPAAFTRQSSTRVLQPALATLAARSPLPARATVTLTERPSPAIEEIVYFCAAELLTNAAKHSGGSAVSLQLAQDGDLLRLTVADDGVGGAQIAGTRTERPGGATRHRRRSAEGD